MSTEGKRGDWYPVTGNRILLRQYLFITWGLKQPDASLLHSFGVFQQVSEEATASDRGMEHTLWGYLLTPKAFALLDVLLEHKIFISYKRSESSAFALLLYDRLRALGFDVFIEMQKLNPGEVWRERLHSEIDRADVFICLISSKSLDSENVRDEIRWAMKNRDKPAIAIWHNGYSYDGKTYSEFAHLLDEKNAIVVSPEHILGYDNAITQLTQFLKPTDGV